MTTPNIAPEKIELEVAPENDERKRRSLLLVLMLLLLLVCCVGYFIVSYLIKPQPVSQMVPVINNIVSYPPAYKSSINNIDRPIGVTGSADGQRIYVAETSGQRFIKMFDRDGTLLKSFGPPKSTADSRLPSYMALSPSGRLFVADANGIIDIYDADGNYIDAIIGKEMTISKYLAGKIPGGLPGGAIFAYDGISNIAYYKTSGDWQAVQGEQVADFAPVGLRFTKQGDLLITDISGNKHSVIVVPAASLNGSFLDYNPVLKQFGVEGKDAGQFSFPNSAVTDSKGNYYVSDSNNGRISVWKPDLTYSTFFGFGSAESGLNLPHGIWMDDKDHLHVVDVVGQVVRVYDVSGAEPTFIYNFGDFGLTEGLFNFPNDIFIDGTGRLYVADRENNRIQVWSY